MFCDKEDIESLLAELQMQNSVPQLMEEPFKSVWHFKNYTSRRTALVVLPTGFGKKTRVAT